MGDIPPFMILMVNTLNIYAMKNVIHYVLILDQSGSMCQLKKEVILSFNEQVDMILKLVKSDPDALVKLTLCLFNDEIVFKQTGQEIDQIIRLDQENYQPDSMTALYDAIGVTIMKINEITQPSDQVFIAIFTDGLENASKFYSASDISNKINDSKLKGWEVKFFCRMEDRKHYKKKLNISEDEIYSMSIDQAGFQAMENQIRYSVTNMFKNPKSPKL